MARQLNPKRCQIFDQMPDCWGCKDKNSVFMYGNEAYGKLVGIENPLDIIGRTAFDLPCEAAVCAPLFEAQDREVIASAKPLRILDVHPFSGGEWRIHIFTKMPLRDDENNIVGTIFQGRDITSVSNLELGSLLGRMYVSGKTPELVKQGSYLLSNPGRENIQLTRRESEVLFFLLRSKTVKTISSILNLSSRTVEHYLASLKMKFSTANKYELVDRAIELGHHNYIPQSLFSQQLSIALRDE